MCPFLLVAQRHASQARLLAAKLGQLASLRQTLTESSKTRAALACVAARRCRDFDITVRGGGCAVVSCQ